MAEVKVTIPDGEYCCSDTSNPLCCPLYNGEVDNICRLYNDEVLDSDEEGFVLKCKQCLKENV